MNPNDTPNPYQAAPQPGNYGQQPQSPVQVPPQVTPDYSSSTPPPPAPAQYPSTTPQMQPGVNIASPIPNPPQPGAYSSQFQNPALTPTIQTGMFKGRLNRIGFLLSFVYVIIYFLIPLALVFLLKGNPIASIASILFGIVGVALVIPIGFSIVVRRWHDLDRSGWMALLALIPFVGFVLLLIYLLVPGTKGSNDYGAIDNRPSTFRKVLFGK